MKQEKQEKKTFNILKFLGQKIKPKKSPDRFSKENHQPSWMYRNE